MITPEFEYQIEIGKLAKSINKNALGVEFYINRVSDDAKAIMFARKVIHLAKELEKVINNVEQEIVPAWTPIDSGILRED